MRKVLTGFTVVVSAWVFSVVSYASLPERVAIHWNFQWEPDDYASRWVAAVLIPTLWLLLPVVALVLPKIDPRGRNYRLHQSAYWSMWNWLMLVVGVVQILIVGTGRGWDVDGARMMSALIGVVFIGLGNQMGRLRANWFLGIRTPWTLASDEVWRRTHRLAARTWIVAGALLLIAALQPAEWFRSAAWIVALVLALAIPLVYSFVDWRRSARDSSQAAGA